MAAMVGTSFYLRKAEATEGSASQKANAVQAPLVNKKGLPETGRAVGPEKAPQAAVSSAVTADAATGPSNRPAQPPALKVGNGGSAAGQNAPSGGTQLAGTTVKSGAPAKSGSSDAPGSARAVEPDPAPQAPATGAVDLDQLEHEIDQLSARASAIDGSLNRLQQQQARQGLGLRGDMAARQESMKVNLSKAADAIGQRNSVRAERYKGLAEADVEALERFLGR